MDPSDYANDLKRQVNEREQERTRKKQEHEQYEKKLEAEIANYNPWGRGGAGAPLKDAQGNSVANRNHMKQAAADPIANQKEQMSRVQGGAPSPKQPAPISS